jgi:hypothetical protein
MNMSRNAIDVLSALTTVDDLMQSLQSEAAFWVTPDDICSYIRGGDTEIYAWVRFEGVVYRARFVIDGGDSSSVKFMGAE